MNDCLSTSEAVEMLKHVCKKIVESEPYLTQIDNMSGDGDHGVGMQRGFSSLYTYLCQCEAGTFYELFKQSGIQLVKNMGGASGVLFGTLFMGGIGSLEPADSLSVGAFAEVMRKAFEEIQRRGRAKPGDKTMLDALAPAVEALEKSAQRGDAFAQALDEAALSADAGRKATAFMVAKTGRARQYAEQTLGSCDAGATSVALIFSAMAEWSKANRKN